MLIAGTLDLAALKGLLGSEASQLPALPPKTWGRNVEAEFLAERQKALRAFLHSLLKAQQHRVCQWAPLRSFLELDTKLPELKEEAFPDDDEDEAPAGAAAGAGAGSAAAGSKQ